MTETNDYKKDVDRIFSSGLPEWVLRSMSIYIILKDRLYTDVLPKVIAVIKAQKEMPELSKEKERMILGKLLSCGIYIMRSSVEQFFKEDLTTTNGFCLNILNLFLKDFNETIDTLDEYARDTSMGKSQVVFALGKMVCDVLGIKDIVFAYKISTFFSEINKIEINTTDSLLTMPIDEARNMVKSIAIQHGLEEWGIQWYSQ